MTPEQRLADTYIREVIGPVAREVVRDAIRRERARQHPINKAGRALGSVWRTIASGGWE